MLIIGPNYSINFAKGEMEQRLDKKSTRIPKMLYITDVRILLKL